MATSYQILMFSFDNKKHHLPHIHAQYAEHAAIIAVRPHVVHPNLEAAYAEMAAWAGSPIKGLVTQGK